MNLFRACVGVRVADILFGLICKELGYHRKVRVVSTMKIELNRVIQAVAGGERFQFSAEASA